MGIGNSFYYFDDSECIFAIFHHAILKSKSNHASLHLKSIEWFPVACKINLNYVLWLCTVWLLSTHALFLSPHSLPGLSFS